MYIWILLATIMIALSFFNLSPRADKEGVFTEVKALSLITRFKIEHTAFSRVAECKLLNSISTDPTFSLFDPSDGIDKYVWENSALPIGYERGNDLSTIFHYTFCMDDDVELGGSPNLASCQNSSETPAHRYSVSFAKIPDRWLSKDNGEVIPVLSNTLAKQYIKGTILGITDCTVASGGASIESCTFKGTASYIKNLNETTQTTGFLSFNGSSGFYNKLFTDNSINFKSTCGGLCFFAIHKLSNKDVDTHCVSLYNQYLAQQAH